MLTNRIEEFVAALVDCGYSTKYWQKIKCYVSSYIFIFDDFEESTILEAAKDYKEVNRSSTINEYSRAVKLYRDFINTGVVPTKPSKKVLNNYKRPKHCAKDCDYNTCYGCTYKPGEALDTIPTVKGCIYFKPKVYKTKKNKLNKYVYRDSHSVMFRY